MCEFIKAPNVAMGWGCCRCSTYNGIQRMECKECKVPHHEPLDIKGDCTVGVYYEDSGATNVKVLSVKADADGVGLELEATGAPWNEARLLNRSPMVTSSTSGVSTTQGSMAGCGNWSKRNANLCKT